MKITSYFLLPITLISLMVISIDAMKRQRDTAMIVLKCNHLTESIEVPKTIIRHSVTLNNLFIKYPFESSYSVDVADQETLCAMVDCLKIIDAGQDVENNLLDYLYDFVEKYTEEVERDNFINAIESLKVEQLTDCFNCFEVYYNRKKANEMINKCLDNVIQEAKDIFVAIEDKQNSAIVIDVDDTALSTPISCGKIIINDIETPFPYFPALLPVRDLYKQIVDLGFKVFFLTARVEKSSPDLDVCDAHQATVQNLKEEGYDVFEQVICVPYEARQQMRKDSNGDNDLFVDLHAEWKERERNKIAEKFTVVGTLDDIKENLRGENVGHAVLIPKFFK